MKLNFLGCGSAFNPSMGNTAAYFESNGCLYLLDCGETVFETLMEQVDLKAYKQIIVLITHLHADHVGSLGSLISYYYCVLKKRLYVIHPKGSIVQLLQLLGIEDDFYHYEAQFPEQLSPIKVEAVPVEHVKNMDAFGYLLEDDEKCIYYSGDAANIPLKIIRELESHKIDYLYQDTCSHKSDHPTHCYIGELEKLIPLSLRNKVYCMHLDQDYSIEVQRKGFQVVNRVKACN